MPEVFQTAIISDGVEYEIIKKFDSGKQSRLTFNTTSPTTRNYTVLYIPAHKGSSGITLQQIWVYKMKKKIVFFSFEISSNFANILLRPFRCNAEFHATICYRLHRMASY